MYRHIHNHLLVVPDVSTDIELQCDILKNKSTN